VRQRISALLDFDVERKTNASTAQASGIGGFADSFNYGSSSCFFRISTRAYVFAPLSTLLISFTINPRSSLGI
jgi:hypothetical protein